jgi:hypothetical protein
MAETARRIAVVAIHGVGDHKPYESARAVANLLARLRNGAGKPLYANAQEQVQRVNIDPAQTRGRGDYDDKWTWGPLHAMAAEVAGTPRALPDSGPESLAHLFMREQLALGECDGGAYRTLRVGAIREEGCDRREVSVFDMHWADLSGVGSAFTRILYELYQILFHLTSIGANNLQAARAHLSRSGQKLFGWLAFTWLHLGASMILVWPIALFNLMMLALLIPIMGVSLFHRYVPTGAASAAVPSTLTFTLGSLLAGLALSRWTKIGAVRLGGALGALGLMAFTTYRWLSDPVHQGMAGPLLAAQLGIAAVVAVYFVVRAYALRRPGSGRAALTCFALWCASGVWAWHAGRLAPLRTSEHADLIACLNGFELLFYLCAAFWGLFAVAYTLTLGAGAVALLGVADTHRERARRTRWTAILTLTVPPIVFLVVTIVGWTALIALASPLVPVDAYAGGLRYTPILIGAGAPSVQEWARQTLEQAGLVYLRALAVSIVAAALMAAWAFGPMVWFELKPPRTKGTAFARVRRLSLTLGNWLTAGFRFLRFSGYALIAGVLVFFYFVAARYMPRLPGAGAWTSGGGIVDTLGVALAGAGAGLIGFGGKLSKLALGFRPVVRTVMDVDNWLREHPRDSNPTATICARYTSLLRHICAASVQGGRPYDAIVIVAHSQGTVITADLLRFLFAEREAVAEGRAYEPELAPIFDGTLPVWLFTMGCPLHQLYSLRFPYLYGWARTEAESASAPPADDSELRPDPADLGVQAWVNAYRSGDYIGRHLWRGDRCRSLFEIAHAAKMPKFVFTDSGQTRVEYCIGPGAHTHYWDSTSDAIAAQLDWMIANV